MYFSDALTLSYIIERSGLVPEQRVVPIDGTGCGCLYIPGVRCHHPRNGYYLVYRDSSGRFCRVDSEADWELVASSRV